MQQQLYDTAQQLTNGFKFTDAQEKACDLLIDDDARHILLYGGSRSGKTFLLLFFIVLRALKIKSRHVVLRFRFAHVKQSIWYGSLPKVFDALNLKRGVHYTENKSDWFIRFVENDSEIWFGGLDEKERVEKILGNEYSTIYFNEASYIPYSSYIMALTRLAENSGLALRSYVDCNPPSTVHWTYKIFMKGIDPKSQRHLDKNKYKSMLMNPEDNIENLPKDFIPEILENLPPAQRDRFLLGKWGEEEEGSYYGTYIAQLEERNRIKSFALPINQKLCTAWDIGIGDSTAIWFFYKIENDIYVYDYYENHGKGLEHYVQYLRERGYLYDIHYAPHDIAHNEWGTGKTRLELGRKLGINFRQVRMLKVDDGINAVRITLPRCYFHETNTVIGLENLKGYRKEFSDKLGDYKIHPLHDFTSHAADAFRYLCVGINEKVVETFTTNAYAFNNLLEHSIKQRETMEELYG